MKILQTIIITIALSAAAFFSGYVISKTVAVQQGIIKTVTKR